ncbi:MAG: hypothetical protein HYV09_15405 [Deltaproteobacteria bacterium]|nr:hypothetical protein [Deltaproteobacteria bacterium]
MYITRTLLLVGAITAFAGTAAAAEPDVHVRTARLDPHGQISGVILTDGTELVAPMSERLSRVARPGDPVRRAVSADQRRVLVNERTNEQVALGPRENEDLKPLVARPIGIGGGPVATDRDSLRIDDVSSLDRLAVTARVSLVLKSNVGAPSGLLLEDGTQVHLVPRVSGALGRVQPGDLLRVVGLGTQTESGASMWALFIIAEDQQVLLDLERGDGAPEIGLTGR